MAVEDRTRHERLRALLPRAYATDPRDSVLGVLLEVLANGLRDFDRATERALRDKWVATADGARDAIPLGLPEFPTDSYVELGGEPRPLEHLGAALELLRQPWEDDEQGYRGRVARLATLLAHGLATPRALLSFTIGALGGEPCPRLERSDDTTTAIGLAPGRLARCRSCRGGRITPEVPCPLQHERTMSASLVDNPRRVVRLRRESLLVGDDGVAVIHFDSDSLFADRPELELHVPGSSSFDEQTFDVASFAGEGRIVPSFRSQQTRERIVVMHALGPGDTLTILPPSPYDPSTPAHQQWWVDPPSSPPPPSPVVRVNGVIVDVPVISSRGVTFDRSRFGVDRFASAEDAPRFDVGSFEAASFDSASIGTVGITTPTVVPGPNTWEYAPLGPVEIATALASVPPGASLPSPPVVDAVDTQPVALRLRWWARPAARFLLRIPSSQAVQRAVQQGAADYVRRVVERTRPVGVKAIIDFLQTPFREVLEPGDDLRGVAVSIAEPLAPLDVTATSQALPAELLEGLEQAAFDGIFDVTPFDFSRFDMPLVELSDALEPAVRGGFIGTFDAIPFEFGIFAE